MPDGDNLTGRLAQLRDRYPDAQPEMVADVVRAVLATMSGDLTARETSLLAEVEELGAHDRGRQGRDRGAATWTTSPRATSPRPRTSSTRSSPTPRRRPTRSWRRCETLDRVGAELKGEAATSLQDATTRIYEACSFQDITGQRITKVVATLKPIEGKVAHIMQAFGAGDGSAPSAATAPAAAPGDADLLNGPQLPTSAMDQSDIDALLASFD